MVIFIVKVKIIMTRKRVNISLSRLRMNRFKSNSAIVLIVSLGIFLAVGFFFLSKETTPKIENYSIELKSLN